MTRAVIPLVTLAVALGVAGLLELERRAADFERMTWILAPTAGLSGALSGARFEREPGRAYLCRDRQFEIVPACAGLRFMSLAFLGVVLAGVPSLRRARSALAWLAGAAAAAWGTTLLANALRITVAMWLHEGGAGAAPPWAHTLAGVTVYFTFLCGLHALAVRAAEQGRACAA